MFKTLDDAWFWPSILTLNFDTWFWCLILTLDFDAWFWHLILTLDDTCTSTWTMLTLESLRDWKFQIDGVQTSCICYIVPMTSVSDLYLAGTNTITVSNSLWEFTLLNVRLFSRPELLHGSRISVTIYKYYSYEIKNLYSKNI